MQENKFKTLDEVVKVLAKYLKDSGKSPAEVKLGDVQGIVSDRQMRKYGGLRKLLALASPDFKPYASLHEIKSVNSHISKLENELGKREYFQERLLSEVESIISPIKVKAPKLNINSKKGIYREMVAMLNDTHYGLIVDPEEINNVNKFDFTEASRRTAFFLKQIIDFKPHVRNEVKKMHLIINGDIIAGLIHGLETKGIHLMIHQTSGALHILSHVVKHLAENFPEVVVHCQPGNHDRSLHKHHGKRPTSEVYDSYMNIIYYAMSSMFKETKHVSFNIPKTPYGFIDLPAGRLMYTHGDTMFSKTLGNPGSSINVRGLSDSLNRFNAGEISRGNPAIKALLLGHVHTYAQFVTFDGVQIYIAPSLSGTDPYAHQLTINNNFIGQTVFESTKDYIIGDSRLVRLNDADKISSLDQIIPPYKLEIACQKEKKK